MLGLYLHIPFCRQRCLYCDFITYAGREDFIPAYVKALRDEILFVGQNLAQPRPPVGSVYFGGGTPSLLQPAQVETLLEAARSSFSLDPRLRSPWKPTRALTGQVIGVTCAQSASTGFHWGFSPFKTPICEL